MGKNVRRINISYPLENRTTLKQKVAFKRSFPSFYKLTKGAKCTWQKDSPEVGTTRGPACIVGRSVWRPTVGGLWRPSGSVSSAPWLSVSARGTASHCSTKIWPKTHRSETTLLTNDIQWLKINKTVKNINSQKTCWRNKGYIIQIIETFWESFGLFWRLFVRLNKCFLYKWFVSLTIGFYSVFF